VQRLLVSGTVRPVIRKKAALCLLRLFRRNPDVLNKDEWCAHSALPATRGSPTPRALQG
jgi:AP-2 complex subunit alpha